MPPSPISYASLHPRFAWMRDHLAALAPAGLLPSRRQLDPLQLRTLLPFITLLDVVRAAGGLRYRYRLIGTRQTEIVGRDRTGEFIDTVASPALYERLRKYLDQATASRQPVYNRFPLPFAEFDVIDCERVYFPLADDGREVDVLLVLNSYPSDRRLNRGGMPPQPTPDNTETKTPAENSAGAICESACL